jgi:hypothetical protein
MARIVASISDRRRRSETAATAECASIDVAIDKRGESPERGSAVAIANP